MGEVTAPTQELANDICSSTRIAVLHSPYPGQMATAGNFAIPLNPPETPTGPVCQFTVYHLMEVDSPDRYVPRALHGDLTVSEVPLRELAQVIRSKNAGPFELTFDIIFDRKAAYEEVKASGALTAEKLAGLYNIPRRRHPGRDVLRPRHGLQDDGASGAGQQGIERRARHVRRRPACAADGHHDPLARRTSGPRTRRGKRPSSRPERRRRVVEGPVLDHAQQIVEARPSTAPSFARLRSGRRNLTCCAPAGRAGRRSPRRRDRRRRRTRWSRRSLGALDQPPAAGRQVVDHLRRAQPQPS